MKPLVSIIINNFNYGRFVAEAIDSALAQTYCPCEVIVVDDGSTDDSCLVIASYAERTRPIMKSNGGQASALNVGFAASHGDYVCFLDADDMLLPKTIEHAVALCISPDFSKVHWPLRVVDGIGRDLDRILPNDPLPQGDLREQTRRDGPCIAANPPTSGNLWSRRFLCQVLPMPEQEYRICADAYLLALAPALGTVGRLDDPGALYRQHGANNFWQLPFEEALVKGVRAFDLQCAALAQHYRQTGDAFDVAHWKHESWWHQLAVLVGDLQSLPPGSTLILADRDELGTTPILAGHRRRPFLQRNDEYWGPPDSDAAAMEALESMRSAGADYFVLAWPVFWWLDEYRGFFGHLRERFECVMENDRVQVFHLRPEKSC